MSEHSASSAHLVAVGIRLSQRDGSVCTAHHVRALSILRLSQTLLTEAARSFGSLFAFCFDLIARRVLVIELL